MAPVGAAKMHAAASQTGTARAALLAVGTALIVGVALDLGPLRLAAGQLLSTADAQEVEDEATGAPIERAEPSEADRAALRYFAREGNVDRLDAELRRLRALYPGWQPPRDLLDPQRDDEELAAMWQLVGEQDYAGARAAIAERLQRDPTWEVPPRLGAILDLAEARAALVEASEAGDNDEVLAVAEANEELLTCENVDALWRVADAFVATGRPKRAFDAYAYVIQRCEDETERAASLQKAAQTLDASFVSDLFALEAGNEAEGDAFSEARLDIVRGAVAAAGESADVEVPAEWLERLAEHARTGTDLDDAMLIGYYLYRQGRPAEAAQWFRYALDNGQGSDAAEGYIVALRATDDREDAFLAREVAYRWREETPELMEAYLDSVATLLTADEFGGTSITDVEQRSVDRFAPIVIGQRDANGAQALGWYAFNTCQFVIAEEWFISSANWVPTEASIFGLALTRLRLGDEPGFGEVVDEWGPIYASVRALGSGEDLDPVDPVTGDEDDPTEEVGVDAVVCDPAERERLRELILREEDERRPDRRDVRFIEAGSLTAAALGSDPTSVGSRAARRSIGPADAPGGPFAILQAQAQAEPQAPAEAADGAEVPPLPLVPVPARPAPADPAPAVASPRPAPDRPQRAGSTAQRPVLRGRRADDGGAPRDAAQRPSRDQQESATVRRRVREEATDPLDAEVQAIIERPRPARGSGGQATGGGTAAQRALASRDFARCLAVTDRAVRAGTLTPADAAARGFCLLELERPFEAAEAFALARVGRGSSAAADVSYGASLAALASNLTAEAAVIASETPLSRPRRTELQVEILTQRALAANRDGRPAETLYYLDQRERIAPLQKDLMLLRGYAYRSLGDTRSAERIFRALNVAGGSAETRRAINVLNTDRARGPLSGTLSSR